MAAPILLAVAERYGFILIVLIEGEVGRGAISGCRALSRPHQAAVLVPLIVEEDQSRRLHTRSSAQRIRLAADDRLRQSRMIGDREPERAVRLAHVDAFDVDLVEFRARARLHECTGRHDRDENDRHRRCPPQAPNLAPQLLVQGQAYRQQYGLNAIHLLPVNLYGPHDNFDPGSSHVIPALIRKCVEAQARGDTQIVAWGDGSPTREFLHVDDLASACVFLLEKYDSPEIINVGWGEDISIRDLAELICDVIGFDGELAWDTTKPDGTPRKLLDVSKIRALGWKPAVPLRDGIVRTYDWFRANCV